VAKTSSFFLKVLEQRTPEIPMFFAPRKPKATVFTMLFASGRKRYLPCFLDSTYKKNGIYAGGGGGRQMNSNRLNNQVQQHVKTQM